jgi:uncharacterized phosphosugar-binding protein
VGPARAERDAVSSGAFGGTAPPVSEANAAAVFAVAEDLLSRLLEGQLPALEQAAALLSGRLMAGGTVFVFGTGHSRSVAMELAGRAGGLVAMQELVLEDLVADGAATREELVDGRLERRPEAARALLAPVATGPQDSFIVISHSGCNGAPVEMALQARARSLPVVAITSLDHGRAVSSRHPSGRRLLEVATLCIDTCAPYADTVIRLPSQLGVCSVSSFAGVLIAQALTAEIVRCYLDAGRVPPLLVSRNLVSP